MPLKRATASLSSHADLWLLATAAIWGSTFVIIKAAVADTDPFVLISLRFVVAFIALALLFRHNLLHWRWPEVAAGVLLGILIFGGFALQTVGLQFSSATKAGFITGLSVVLVPPLSWLILKHALTRQVIAAAFLSAAGLALMSLTDGFAIESGDLILLGCAFFFGLHIVFLGKFAVSFNTARLTLLQVATVALLSGCATLVEYRQFAFHVSTEGWFAIVYTGVLATALAYLVQTTAQRKVPPSRTALVFTTEPVWALVFAFVIAGERLMARQWVGAAIILGAMLLAEEGLRQYIFPGRLLRARRSRRREAERQMAGGADRRVRG